MDTNSITLLINALAQQKATVPSSNLILILASLGPILAAAAAWFSRNAALNTEKMKASADATAVSVEKAHLAINSERSATVEEIKALKAEVLKLSEQLAFKKGEEEAKSEQHAEIPVLRK